MTPTTPDLRAALERLIDASRTMPNGYHYCRWCAVADDHADGCEWVRQTRELDEAKAQARVALASPAPASDGAGYHGRGEGGTHYDPKCPRCIEQRDRLRPPVAMDRTYATTDEERDA